MGRKEERKEGREEIHSNTDVAGHRDKYREWKRE